MVKANKLYLNTDKTYYIIFHRARIKLKDNDYPKIMCLGVILDSKMSWIQHIAYVKNNVSKGIGIMFKARTYLDRRSLINLYNAYIYPYLIYWVESWGNAPKCHLDQLYILKKKRIIRLITFSKYNQGVHVPSQFIFRELQVLPLYNLIQNRIGFMMYKSLNGLLPDMSELCMVNNEVHDHFMRQSNFLYTRKGNNHAYIQSFNNTGPLISNCLQKKINFLFQ